MDFRLLFYSLAAFIFLVINIYMISFFIKWRTKRNLTILIISIIFLIITILSYFYPGTLFPISGITIQIILWSLVIISLIIFLFYPGIKRFLDQRKMKNK